MRWRGVPNMRCMYWQNLPGKLYAASMQAERAVLYICWQNLPRKLYAASLQAERPVLYVGGGCLDAAPELRSFVERTGIPVASTLMGLGTFPESHNLCLGMLGMHGTYPANYAINNADLLLAIGVRFDDRVTGAPAVV